MIRERVLLKSELRREEKNRFFKFIASRASGGESESVAFFLGISSIASHRWVFNFYQIGYERLSNLLVVILAFDEMRNVTKRLGVGLKNGLGANEKGLNLSKLVCW